MAMTNIILDTITAREECQEPLKSNMMVQKIVERIVLKILSRPSQTDYPSVYSKDLF